MYRKISVSFFGCHIIALAAMCFYASNSAFADDEAVSTDANDSGESMHKFLDKSLSVQARAQAARGIDASKDANFSGQFAAVAKDREENDSLRAIALSKLSDCNPKQSFDLALKILKDRKNGQKDLRSAAATLLRLQTSFGFAKASEYRLPALDALRGLLTTEEPKAVRRAALSYLSSIGDPAAEESLKVALTNPAEGIVDQQQAIGYASADNATKYQQQIAPLLEKSDAPTIQATAVQALASIPQYQEQIRRALNNEKAPLETRIAAVDSLSLYAPNVVNDALKIAADPSAPEQLRSTCLYKISGTATRFSATPHKWTDIGIDRKQLDSQIKDILKTQTNPEAVHDAASSYIKQHVDK